MTDIKPKTTICARIKRRFGIYPKFWLKTCLYRFFPGGWGYYRKLSSLKDETYVHERDRPAVREKHTGSSGWKAGPELSGEFVYRDYDDYNEYVEHQTVKFDEMLKAGEAFTPKVVSSIRRQFFRRFRQLPFFVNRNAKILCAGARQGTEVEVLWDLGYKNAFGTDLNPGPDNVWVQPGDFMNIDAADNSIDVVYCNAIDHVRDMDDFLKEQVRVIRDDGFAIYECIPQTKGGAFEAVEWKSDSALMRKMLEYFGRIVWMETESRLMWFMLKDPVKK